MEKYKWNKLNKLQVGRYAEYFVKMEFTLFGFDIYTSEVDDRGIDFVVRKEPNSYYDLQVKSARHSPTNNYIFLEKTKFALRENLYLALVLFYNFETPRLFLIPSFAWNEPNNLFVSRDYGGDLKSKPEWGLNLTKKGLLVLNQYKFEDIIQNF